jgi:hypothetical protein
MRRPVASPAPRRIQVLVGHDRRTLPTPMPTGPTGADRPGRAAVVLSVPLSTAPQVLLMSSGESEPQDECSADPDDCVLFETTNGSRNTVSPNAG